MNMLLENKLSRYCKFFLFTYLFITVRCRIQYAIRTVNFHTALMKYHIYRVTFDD
jgi:hypothetical protein